MDVLIFTVLISLSALFSASETAFFSLRESEVAVLVRRKARNAKLVARLHGSPQRLLVTILVGNNIVNISIASYATVLAIDHFGSLGAGIATGLSTIVVLLLGEIFPKSLAYIHRRTFVSWVAPPLYSFFLLCYPITTIFVFFEQYIRSKNKDRAHNSVSEEEIRIMAELGLAQGEIDRREHEMIERIFQFDDIPVGTIMTPREKIESLSGEVPIDQIAYAVAMSGFSRFPVHDGNENTFIGYVHTNDVMRVLNSDNRGEVLGTIVQPLTRVPEHQKIENVFIQMTRERSHLYLVHRSNDPDEVIGLVTLEDVLEEIVGEIEDEGDRRAAKVATTPRR